MFRNEIMIDNIIKEFIFFEDDSRRIRFGEFVINFKGDVINDDKFEIIIIFLEEFTKNRGRINRFDIFMNNFKEYFFIRDNGIKIRVII